MKYDNLKTLGYILAIVILFIPLVQLALSTFIDSPDEPFVRSCWDQKGKLNQTCEDDNRVVWDAYDDVKGESDVLKFILASIFGLVVILFAVFSKLQPVVKYGLFSGAVMNEFISIIVFDIEKSVIGWILLVAIFTLVVWFINRDVK